MITYKIKIRNKIDIDTYLKVYNSVLRYSYNRFRDNPKLSKNELELIILSSMKNINLLDYQIVRCAVIHSTTLKDREKVIFGGKKNYIDFLNGKISKDEFKKLKLQPMMLFGSKSDTKGNRKAELNIIENNSILLKLSRNNHQVIELEKISKKYKEELSKIQVLCEQNKAYFSLALNNEHIFISIDEKYLSTNEELLIKHNRFLSIDLNPNYIGYIVADYKSEFDYSIVHKEVIDLRKLNNLPENKYKTNKRKYETSIISKHIIKIAKHYQVEQLVFEKLSIKSKDHKKGKQFNKLVNNNWNRSSLISNLKKRCHIEGISYQEILPEYSSFIGCMINPEDVDSIAAAIELSRRAFLFKGIFKEKSIEKKNIVFPDFNERLLNDRWKKTLIDLGKPLSSLKSWKDLYSIFKESKIKYRFLLSDSKPDNFFSLLSIKSLINLYAINT